jgi:hypothetical protein
MWRGRSSKPSPQILLQKGKWFSLKVRTGSASLLIRSAPGTGVSWVEESGQILLRAGNRSILLNGDENVQDIFIEECHTLFGLLQSRPA